ncbi:type IV pilus assembly protein PilM [Glaciihabitans sp. UYNi722]|uniref:type IV pilus assembly protein PilM n=1 Tax=Glaciihabitans sp. UYNi722 TaxID=3156344 RepID=UPI003397539D
MAKTIVGVDISANGIRAAELGGALKTKPVLLRYAAVSLPPGAVTRGEVVEPRTVSTALKQLWSSAGFTSKEVVLGIGNARVLARDLTVPKMPLHLIRESLPFHVQEMLPFPTEDALLDFYPISEGTDANGPVVNGLLVAALKDAVLANVKAVELAGLHPVDVDLVPFALSRILLRGADAAGTTAMIDVGASTTTVVVSTDGVPQFVRIIPAGGDDLTNALSSRLGLPLESAEATKRALGLSSQPATAEEHNAVGVIFELTGELITSVRNTLTYFAGTRPSDPIGRVVLSGGGSSLGGFRDALAEYTRLPVTVGNPLETISVGRHAEKSIEPDGAEPSLAVAIGLALGSAA